MWTGKDWEFQQEAHIRAYVGTERAVSEATPCVGGARQEVSVRTLYMGMLDQRLGAVSEVAACVGGGNANVLETTPPVGEARQGGPGRTPYMRICGQRKSVIWKPHLMWAGKGKKFGNHALCERARHGVPVRTP